MQEINLHNQLADYDRIRKWDSKFWIVTPVWAVRLYHTFITISVCIRGQEKKRILPSLLQRCSCFHAAFLMLRWEEKECWRVGAWFAFYQRRFGGNGMKLGMLLAHVLGMGCFLWAGFYCPSLGQDSTSIERASASACSWHCKAGQGLLLCSAQGNLSWPAQPAGVTNCFLTRGRLCGKELDLLCQQAPCIPAPLKLGLSVCCWKKPTLLPAQPWFNFQSGLEAPGHLLQVPPCLIPAWRSVLAAVLRLSKRKQKTIFGSPGHWAREVFCGNNQTATSLEEMRSLCKLLHHVA